MGILATAAPDGPRVAVRVNALNGPHAREDLEVVACGGAAAVVVPKASAAALEGLSGRGLPPVVAIVETPHGLQESARIARAPGVTALLLGRVDLAQALHLDARADGIDFLYARSQLVIDSAAAGLQGPLDGVWTAIDDLGGLRAEAELVRSLGFAGKACIHPAHIPIVNAAFRPSPEQVRWAERVVAAYAEAQSRGIGAIRVDSSMIDVPVVARARDILSEARRS